MDQRLLQFLSAENISQAQFADTIGVARASVSHIIAGRNKPGFDFIESMASHFPDLSLEWLISGKGKMYKSRTSEPAESQAQLPLSATPIPSAASAKGTEAAAPQQQPTLPFLNDNPVPEEETKPVQAPKKASVATSSSSPLTAPKTPENGRQISKIVIFYDDGTYQELK